MTSRYVFLFTPRKANDMAPHMVTPQFTPIVDTQVGRLAELVQLLADVPFDTALDQIEARCDPSLDDPLSAVADALVQLRPLTLAQRRTTALVPV